MAVLNLSLDELIDPVIRLDRAYESLRCVGCKGRLEEDRVQLSSLPAYGFAAFSVQ